MPAAPRARRFLAGFALALATLLLLAQSALAEGSANMNTGAATELRTGLMGYSITNAPYWHGYTVLRVYAGAGETIQMGSSAMGLGGSADIRLYAPGTSFASATEPGWRATFPTDPVFATATLDCNTAQPGTGRIESRAQELAGPLPSAGGYTPCQYTAPADGIYALVMTPVGLNGSASPGSVGTPNVTATQQAAISIWDVTVRDGEAEQSGRVFTNIFNLATGPFGTQSSVAAYAYAPAGHLYRVQLYKPNGAAWDLAVNGTGVVDATTREPIFASYKWGPTIGGPYPPTKEPVNTQAVAPQMYAGDEGADSRWPMFVQPPDPIAIGGPGGLAETRGYATTPMAPEGGLSQALSFVGSGGQAGATTPEVGGTIEIDAPQLQELDYILALDLDNDGSFGGGADLEEEGTLSPSGNTYAWGGRDANGTVVPCGTYGYKATSSLPSMHVVQADTESEAGTEIERLTLPGDPNLGDPKLAAYNDVNSYTPTPVTNTAPSAVAEGISGSTFHSWTNPTGQTDFVDTWTPVRQMTGTGTIEVSCPNTEPPPASPPVDNPPATNPPGANPSPTEPSAANPPASNPPATNPPKGHKPPKHHEQNQAPRLVLDKRANTSTARPSSVISYRITVWNKGDGAARNVVVCDEPPAQQETLRTAPRAKSKLAPCWQLDQLPAGVKRTFTLTAMVAFGSSDGVQRNSATVKAANAKGVRSDTAAVQIKQLPDSACRSRLARPGLAFRC